MKTINIIKTACLGLVSVLATSCLDLDPKGLSGRQ